MRFRPRAPYRKRGQRKRGALYTRRAEIFMKISPCKLSTRGFSTPRGCYFWLRIQLLSIDHGLLSASWLSCASPSMLKALSCILPGLGVSFVLIRKACYRYFSHNVSFRFFNQSILKIVRFRYRYLQIILSMKKRPRISYQCIVLIEGMFYRYLRLKF